MEGFRGAWGWGVVILAGFVFLLTVYLLFTINRARNLRSQGMAGHAGPWERQRRAFEIFQLIGSILLLLTGFLTNTFGKDKLPSRWVVLIGGSGVVVGIVLAILGYVQKRSEGRRADESWMQKVQSLVALWPLPRVSEVDPYTRLGVTRSELASRYVTKGDRPRYVP